MKYTNQVQAKNRFKKALLVTATAMTLGLSIGGGATSAFAAEGSVIPITDISRFEQSPEDPALRIEMQDAMRDWYQNNEEEKTLTVLIAADEQYREAHPDWKELTVQLMAEGTKDFKEYYNIKYVPVEFFEWQSHGSDVTDIVYNFKDDYTAYIADHPEFTNSFSVVVGFTANESYDNKGGVLPMTVGTEESKLAIPLVTIKDLPADDPDGFTNVIKHELSHTWGIPDDRGDLRNSVMSSIPGIIEWSTIEMEVINENWDLYPNHKI